MKRAVIVGAMTALFVSGAARAQDLQATPDAVVRAADYCLTVARAELAGTPPVAGGPSGFAAHQRRYGALEWHFGEDAEGRPTVAVSPGRLCTVSATNPEGIASALGRWMSGQTGFQPDNAEKTAYFISVRGGWIRVSWAGIARMEAGRREPMMVLVQAVEGSN